MATKDVIEKYYDCVNRGAWNDWLTLFTVDVSGDEQLAGHFEGIAVLRGAIGAISYGYSKFQMIPLHIVVEGDQAAVIWRCEAANRAGTPIAALIMSSVLVQVFILVTLTSEDALNFMLDLCTSLALIPTSWPRGTD